MTELPTKRMISEALTEKLATMPENVDHNGQSDVDRFADSRRFDRFAEAEIPAVAEPPAQVGMKPNPLQGRSAAGANVPATPNTTLGRIRAQAAKHNTTGA